MTDKSNVITVSGDDLTWINENVPGKSKRERLVNLLLFYKTNGGPRKSDAAVTRTTAPGGCPA
jgi:hypothetical protein